MMKVILDLDTGIDDAMALAYALGSKEIDLIGVTGTFGNVTGLVFFSHQMKRLVHCLVLMALDLESVHP